MHDRHDCLMCAGKEEINNNMKMSKAAYWHFNFLWLHFFHATMKIVWICNKKRRRSMTIDLFIMWRHGCAIVAAHIEGFFIEKHFNICLKNYFQDLAPKSLLKELFWWLHVPLVSKEIYESLILKASQTLLEDLQINSNVS